MNSLGDFIYQLDSLMTYKYTFDNQKGYIVEEYIHCIVLEHLEKFDGEIPRKIKVKQIHNLEEYFSDPAFNAFSERIIKTDNLVFKNNWNRKL